MEMTAQAPEWWDDGWPEWRTQAPWVMHEMVAAQPDLVEPMLADREAADVGVLVREAAERGEPIVVSGCGSSEHGAQAISLLLDEGLRQRGFRGGLVEARQALDSAIDPRPGGVFIAVTHDGGTRATALAAEGARDSGAVVAVVTRNSSAAITSAASVVVRVPIADRSWCHTVAYTGAILAGAAIGAAVATKPVAAKPVREYLAEALTEDGQAERLAVRLWGAAPLVIAGAGPDEITAKEFALKVEEGPRMPAVGRHVETLLHGHLAGNGPATRLVLISVAPGGMRQAARFHCAATAAAKTGMPVGAIVSPEIGTRLDAGVEKVVLPEALPTEGALLTRLLGGAAGLQRVTLALIEMAGINPDLIRREERVYWEAASLGDESTEW